MAEIIPAIIGHNFTEVASKMAQVDGLVNWVHLDIMDGTFTPQFSWRAPEDLQELDGKTKIEVHLMIDHPEETLREWLTVVDRIIVHTESTDQLEEILDVIGGSTVEVGVALLMNTTLESLGSLTPKLGQVDVLHIMTIEEIGAQGIHFSDRAPERLRTLRAKFPNVKISVDGGINLETGKLAIEAGVNNLVVGSALWTAPDLGKAIEKFKKL